MTVASCSLMCGNKIQNPTWDGPDILQLMPRNPHRGKQATKGPQSLSKDLIATGSRDLLMYGVFQIQCACYKTPPHFAGKNSGIFCCFLMDLAIRKTNHIYRYSIDVPPKKHQTT